MHLEYPLNALRRNLNALPFPASRPNGTAALQAELLCQPEAAVVEGSALALKKCPRARDTQCSHVEVAGEILPGLIRLGTITSFNFHNRTGVCCFTLRRNQAIIMCSHILRSLASEGMQCKILEHFRHTRLRACLFPVAGGSDSITVPQY